MFFEKHNFRQGVTLLELMIAISLSVIVLGLVISISIIFQKVWQEQFLKNNFLARSADISERLAVQAELVTTPQQLEAINLPYGAELIQNAELISGTLYRFTLQKKIGESELRYYQYFRLGGL